MNEIREFLRPPKFDELANTQRAVLLNAFTIGALLFSFVNFYVVIFVNRNPNPAQIVGAIVPIVTLGYVFYCVRTRQIRRGALVFMVFFSLLLGAFVLLTGGLTSPFMPLNVLLFLFAGYMFDNRVIIRIIPLGILFLVIIFVLTTTGNMPEPFQFPFVRRLISYSALFVLIGVFVVVTNRWVNESLRLAEENERILQERNFELQTIRTGLERNIEARTAQIQASLDVGQVINSILEPDQLINRVVELISTQFGYYYVAIFIADEDGRWAILRGATGEGGAELLRRNHRLEIGGQNMVGTAINTRQPRIALDVGEEAVRFNNPLLPETRSEIALPLVAGENVIGALDAQSTQEAAFTTDNIQVLQSLANQVAVALQNARLFSETNEQLAQIDRLNRMYQEEAWRELTEGFTPAFQLESGQIRPLDTQDLTLDLVSQAASSLQLLERDDSQHVITPLVLRDQVIGALELENTRPWSEDELVVISSVTQQASLALENARLYRETQVTLKRTEALFEVGRAAITATQIEDLLQIVADTIAEALPANRVSVITFEQELEQVTNFVRGGVGKEEIELSVPYEELLDGLSGWVLERRLPALSPKGVADPREAPTAQKRRSETNCGAIIVVPMMYRDTVMGTITAINGLGERNFTQEDADLALAMANQVSSALENAELLEQTRQRAVQLQTAAEVAQVASSTLNVDELMTQTVELIKDRFDLYYAGIFLVDDAQKWAVLRAGTGEAGRIQLENNHRLALGGKSMIGHSIAIQKAQIALDVGKQAIFFSNPVLPKTRSEMALPLISRGEAIGALTIQSEKPAAFTSEDITALQAMADGLANALQNARLFEDAQRSNLELASINEIAAAVTRDFELDRILNIVIDAAEDLFGTSQTAIILPDETGYLNLVAARGVSNFMKRVISRNTIESEYWREALTFPVFVAEDLENLDFEIQLKPIFAREGMRSMALVPLTTNAGVIGTLNLGHREVGGLRQEMRTILRTLGDQVATAIQNARLYQDAQTSLESEQVQRRVADSLAQIAQKITGSVEQRQVQNVLLDELDRLIPAAHVILYEWQEDQREFGVLAQRLPIGDVHVEALTPGDIIAAEDRKDLLDTFTTAEPHHLLDADSDHDHAGDKYLVPWSVGQQVAGVLEVHHVSGAGRVTEVERQIIQGVVQQTAIGLQSAQNFEQTQFLLRRSEALFQVSQVVASQVSLAKLLKSAVNIMADVLPAESVLVITMDFEREEVLDFVASGGPEKQPALMSFDELMGGLTGWVVRNRKPTISMRTKVDPRESDEVRARREETGVGGIIVVPMIYQDRLLGTITAANSPAIPDFDQDDQDLMMSMGNQIAIGIQNANLFQQTQRTAENERLLNEISSSFVSSLNLDNVLRTAVLELSKLPNVDDVSVSLTQDDPQVLSNGTDSIGNVGEKHED